MSTTEEQVWPPAPTQNPDPTQPTPPKGVTKKGLLETLGPGLVTGASDDDPSGIATYSQVGAQFGYGMLWTMLFSYPLMCGIQEISGQIGRVTGRGIAGNLRKFYHPVLLYGIVLLVLVANVINLGADIGAMGAAVKILIGGPALLYAALFAGAVGDDGDVHALRPVRQGPQVAVRGPVRLRRHRLRRPCPLGPRPARHRPARDLAEDRTTSPASSPCWARPSAPTCSSGRRSRRWRSRHANPTDLPLKADPKEAPSELHRIRVDTYTGMAFSNLVAFFIILTAAVTLNAHGVTDIQTSTDAAKALEPIAGRFAFLLFALGIIGTGLLALPVLAGSAAYAVGEALRWRVGLNHKPSRAKGFYGVIAAAMLLGLCLNFVHIDPIKALFWSAVINGVVAVPIMFLMMLMTQNPKVMGEFTLNTRQKVLGWLATAAMLAAAIGLFATWGK